MTLTTLLSGVIYHHMLGFDTVYLHEQMLKILA